MFCRKFDTTVIFLHALLPKLPGLSGFHYVGGLRSLETALLLTKSDSKPSSMSKRYLSAVQSQPFHRQ